MLPPCFAIYGTLHLQRPAKRGENKIVAQRPALKQRGENKIVVSADALETEAKADCPKKQIQNLCITSEYGRARKSTLNLNSAAAELRLQHLPGDHEA